MKHIRNILTLAVLITATLGAQPIDSSQVASVLPAGMELKSTIAGTVDAPPTILIEHEGYQYLIAFISQTRARGMVFLNMEHTVKFEIDMPLNRDSFRPVLEIMIKHRDSVDKIIKLTDPTKFGKRV